MLVEEFNRFKNSLVGHMNVKCIDPSAIVSVLSDFFKDSSQDYTPEVFINEAIYKCYDCALDVENPSQLIEELDYFAEQYKICM